MNSVIDEFVNNYSPNRISRSLQTTNNSVSTPYVESSITYSLSELSTPNDDNDSAKSTSSPSYFSGTGLEESETSSVLHQGRDYSRNRKKKSSTTVISLYGPGGIG